MRDAARGVSFLFSIFFSRSAHIVCYNSFIVQLARVDPAPSRACAARGLKPTTPSGASRANSTQYERGEITGSRPWLSFSLFSKTTFCFFYFFPVVVLLHPWRGGGSHQHKNESEPFSLSFPSKGKERENSSLLSSLQNPRSPKPRASPLPLNNNHNKNPKPRPNHTNINKKRHQKKINTKNTPKKKNNAASSSWALTSSGPTSSSRPCPPSSWRPGSSP